MANPVGDKLVQTCPQDVHGLLGRVPGAARLQNLKEASTET